jgi:hypothetical protein
LKKGVQTAICCPCGNEKILALGLCATCCTLKRQDAEYFGGLREQSWSAMDMPVGCVVIPIPECIIGNREIRCCI